jgi:2-C-methyl-D-erythritol 2,4-cyclodiphosphate synthase
MYITGFGEDSHQFRKNTKGLVLAGIFYPEDEALDADSDGDVIFHAICQAITSVTHVPILGDVAIKLCHEQHIKDSSVYLRHALKTLEKFKIVHCVVSLTCLRPKLQKRSLDIRSNVAKHLRIELDQVGIIFTTGNNLSFAARGEGIDCKAIVTFQKLVDI